MTKFAARFGYTRKNLADDDDLDYRIMIKYAKEHGHDPTGLDEWTMIVSHDGEVHFYPYFIDEQPGQTYDRGWTDRTPLSDPPEKL